MSITRKRLTVALAAALVVAGIGTFRPCTVLVAATRR